MLPYHSIGAGPFCCPAAICALMSTRLSVEQMPYAVRRRRLSSITLAPFRKVMGVPGQRSQAARNVARASSYDAGNMLDDALAIGSPRIDAESEVSSQRGHLRPLFAPIFSASIQRKAPAS